ncbi:hypothetical protein WL84_06595 [Burkholderia cenocepacia]|nr:hypothetical protein WL84_06595 [Burkholderia cenocepacia]
MSPVVDKNLIQIRQKPSTIDLRGECTNDGVYGFGMISKLLKCVSEIDGYPFGLALIDERAPIMSQGQFESTFIDCEVAETFVRLMCLVEQDGNVK